MASNHTEHLGLSQWEAEDAVLREDFNADNAKIDAAIATKGNCRIVTGTYVGDGKYGDKNPTTLTFPGKPLVVMVSEKGFFVALRGIKSLYEMSYNGTVELLTLEWGENSLSWSHYYNADYQKNTLGTEYQYIALIAADEE